MGTINVQTYYHDLNCVKGRNELILGPGLGQVIYYNDVKVHDITIFFDGLEGSSSSAARSGPLSFVKDLRYLAHSWKVV